MANFSLTPTVTAFQGGTDAVVGSGAITTLTFGGTWATAEEFSMIFTDSLSGLQTLVGAGNVTGFVPSYVFTYNNKVYALGGPTIYFSAANLPTTWNDPNAAGNGYVTMINWWSTPEPIVCAQPFQGYLAFFSRWNIQIWSVATNPSSWQIVQQLPNAGVVAPLSARALGLLDVMFLSDTGFRSLRVRDYALTGFISDIGSPVDAFVTANMRANTAANNALACSIVDPRTGNWWCYLNGTIYVLAYYPSNKIVAWSTYLPVDSNGNAFTVTSFAVYKGQVWAFGTDSSNNNAAWAFGGSNNNTYDSTVATVITPFYDAKSPAIDKQSEGFDLVLNAEYPALASIANHATWTASFAMDAQPASPVLTTFYTGNQSTYDIDAITASDSGTHALIQLVTSGTGPATLSAITWHYKIEQETIE